MGKKKAAKKADAVIDDKATRPVRLDLTLADHERIEKCAILYGLSKSSYVRMALFKRMAEDEGRKEGRA